jgi:putative FmdB family regulatory protein
MPIYEYKCLDCRAHLEKMQKVSESPLTLCEKCGGKLEKQWSLSGFQFKGDGWYVTDYSKKSNGKAEKTEKSSGSESTAKTETASKETKSSSAKESSTKKDK